MDDNYGVKSLNFDESILENTERNIRFV